jgi:hypothetical protein
MARSTLPAVIGAFVALGLGICSATAAPASSKGQTCHMEQQCHWVNFKKVCVWVKVCR